MIIPCSHCGRATDFGKADLCRTCYANRAVDVGTFYVRPWLDEPFAFVPTEPGPQYMILHRVNPIAVADDLLRPVQMQDATIESQIYTWTNPASHASWVTIFHAKGDERVSGMLALMVLVMRLAAFIKKVST